MADWEDMNGSLGCLQQSNRAPDRELVTRCISGYRQLHCCVTMTAILKRLSRSLAGCRGKGFADMPQRYPWEHPAVQLPSRGEQGVGPLE